MNGECHKDRVSPRSRSGRLLLNTSQLNFFLNLVPPISDAHAGLVGVPDSMEVPHDI